MRIPVGLLALSLLVAAPVAAAESAFHAAAGRLDGTWQDDQFALRVDSQRAQANVDLDRPFRWQRFLVKEVEGDKVVFTVGAELFEATLQSDSLMLTSTSFRGERRLRRGEASYSASGIVNALGLRR